MKRSLYDILDDADLAPKFSASGEKIRFHCYFCLNEGRDTKKGRNATGYADSGWWSCYSCQRKGGAADIAALTGIRITEVKSRKRKALPPPTDVPEFWSRHLTESQPQDAKLVVSRWLQETRGWSEELAFAGAGWADIRVFDQEMHGRMGEIGRSMSYRPRHRILGGIRDDRGVLRTFTRQWDGIGEKPDIQRYNLSGELTGPLGDVLCYGRIEDAIDAAKQGRPVFITEGFPDTLAAYALTRPLYAAVIGTFNTSVGPSVAWAIAKQLGGLGHSHAGLAADVYIVEQMDPEKNGVIASQVWKDAVVSALSPRCGIHIISMKKAEEEMAKTKGHADSGAYDLADWVADGGTIDGLLDVACEMTSDRPRTLDELRRDMADEIVEVVNDATASWRNVGGVNGDDGRRRVAIVTPPAGGGKTTAALRVSHWVAQNEDPRLDVPWIGDVPKSLGLPDGEVPDARRVLVATSSHKLATEKLGEFAELNGLNAPAVHLQGLMRVCKFKKSKALSRVYAAVGRRGVCGDPGSPDRCSHADTCPGAQDHAIMPGQVAFGHHRTDVEADLVIIDEDPDVMDHVTIEAPEFASIFAAVGSSVDRRRAWWHKNNPDAQIISEAAHAVFLRRARRHHGWISRGGKNYSTVVDGDDLRELLEEVAREAVDAGLEFGDGQVRIGFTEMINRGFLGEDAIPPPRPRPAEIRTDAPEVHRLPSLPAYRVLRDTIRWMWGEKPTEEAAIKKRGPRVDPVPVLVLNSTKAEVPYSLQWWSVRELPAAPLIVLDATGEMVLEKWRKAYHERIDLYPMAMAGRSPFRAIHYRTSISRRLIEKEPDLALSRISGGLVEAVIETKGPTPGKATIGIISHKVIADGMEGRSKTEFGVKLRQMIEGMEAAHNVSISAGYYGLDDRGTNRWKNVDAFVAIGDFVPNISTSDAEAKYLGLDGEQIREGLKVSTVIQAMARSRYAVRPSGERAPLIVYMGKDQPPMNDVRWETMRPRTGPSLDAGGRDIRGLAGLVAYTMGIVGAAVIRQLDMSVHPWSQWADVDIEGANIRTIHKAVDYAAELHKLSPHVIAYDRGRVKLYARSREVAQRWVDENL